MSASKPRTLAELRAHPAVQEVSDERGMGDGLWCYLAPGWENTENPGSTQFHEYTVRELCEEFNAWAREATDDDRAFQASCSGCGFYGPNVRLVVGSGFRCHDCTPPIGGENR